MEAFLTSTFLVAIAEIGEKLARKIPMKPVRILAAALFIVVGILTIWNPLGAPQ